MGSCIICGTSVDGRICSHHEEDVVFEFRGDHPNQLTTDRYYRGTVDGFAEFGVFVDIGDRVTGLLHRSELDRRLDSLDWDPGDVVYVKVQNVRDNGNVDLGWSIRQEEREFRGTLIDNPDWDHERLKSEVEGEGDEESATDAEADSGNAHSGSGGSVDTESLAAGEHGDATASDESGANEQTASESSAAERAASAQSTADQQANEPHASEQQTAEQQATATTGGSQAAGGSAAVVADEETDVDGGTEAGADSATEAESETDTDEAPDPTEVRVGELTDHEGEDVRLEGVVADVDQTSGPTIFTIRDEEGTVECAAFVEAGVRAYPEVEEDDVVRLDGEVRRRRGEIQVETDALVALDDEEREAVETRMADALDERARPDEVKPLADDPTIEALTDEVVDAATAIRRAVLTDRPVIVRHTATADGYTAGVALERATLPLVREEHRQADAVYHYFDRRPLEGGVYDMDDATKDTTQMLENRERHDEKLPLFVFVAAGGTAESLDGFDLLSIYGAPGVVIDDVDADEEIAEAVETIVSPGVTDEADEAAAESQASAPTATTLSATVAAHVNDDVREDLAHLPAVSYWDDAPEAYADLAAEAGFSADDVRDVREAIALEAFYQSYEDKRELITDLLFGDEVEDVSPLAGNVAEQFREKMDDEVGTAIANLKVHGIDDARVAVLDTDAFTHRYDFPPATLLLDELSREVDDVDAIVGVGTDALYLRGENLDIAAAAWEIGEDVPDAAVTVRNTREGRLRFLSGKRDAVVDAALDAVADQV